MSLFNNFSFAGKKALIRVDFNVPLNDAFEITDDNRMRATIPTITKILKEGGSVILMSHLGRPKDGPTEKYSLKHIVKHLSELLGGVHVGFANDCMGAEATDKAAALKAGEVLLLENLRFYKEEEKGDVDFAKKLARLGNVWVNDAFGTAHRAHASTAVIGQFFSDKVSGYVMQAELDNAQKILEYSERPFTAIMGGSKISDKILIIERLLDKVDNLIIGGGMTYTFSLAEGGKIVTGGSAVAGDGYFFAPTVLSDVKPGSTILNEEIFGPVLTIYVYHEEHFETVLELVDQTSPYALTGAVFSKDRYAIELATQKLKNAAGNFYINDKPTGAVVGQQPFGGARASGTNDKAGSMINLLRWVSPRTIKETLVSPTDYRYPFLGKDL